MLVYITNAQTEDRAICNRTFSFVFEHKLIDKPINEIVAVIGKQFLNSPYEAHTLEHSDTEQLVVNLHSFDCVTFVENVLSISRCVKLNRLSFDEYQRQLRLIRYRRGVINGYASRLHYFSEWISDNEEKGIIKNISKKLGGRTLRKKINFMTSHRDKYKQLATDSIFNFIRITEDSLSRRSMFFIPKSKIKNCKSKIHDGVIIAMTSSQEGLDIAHTGIAVRVEDGSLHYMHAPDVNGKVKISNEALDKYVQHHSQFSGIIVLEASEPAE